MKSPELNYPMRKMKIAGVAALAICGMLSCQPPRKDVFQFISDERLITATSIREGSYFIYSDSATGDQVRFDVYKQLHDTVENSGGKINTYTESCSYYAEKDIFNSMNVSATTDYLSGNPPFDQGLGIIQVQYLRLPFVAGSTDISDYVTTEYLNYYERYDVLGKSYPNVYETVSRHHEYNSITPDVNYRTFYSLDSGLIKIVVTSPTKNFTKNLISSRIIR